MEIDRQRNQEHRLDGDGNQENIHKAQGELVGPGNQTEVDGRSSNPHRLPQSGAAESQADPPGGQSGGEVAIQMDGFQRPESLLVRLSGAAQQRKAHRGDRQRGREGELEPRVVQPSGILQENPPGRQAESVKQVAVPVEIESRQEQTTHDRGSFNGNLSLGHQVVKGDRSHGRGQDQPAWKPQSLEQGKDHGNHHSDMQSRDHQHVVEPVQAKTGLGFFPKVAVVSEQDGFQNGPGRFGCRKRIQCAKKALPHAVAKSLPGPFLLPGETGQQERILQIPSQEDAPKFQVGPVVELPRIVEILRSSKIGEELDPVARLRGWRRVQSNVRRVEVKPDRSTGLKACEPVCQVVGFHLQSEAVALSVRNSSANPPHPTGSRQVKRIGSDQGSKVVGIELALVNGCPGQSRQAKGQEQDDPAAPGSVLDPENP